MLSGEKTILSHLNAIVLLILLLVFVPGETFAQAVGDEKKPPLSSENGSLETEQGCPAELESSIPSPATQDQENQLISEKQDDISLQEGIGDAFAKDHGDKFQPKNKEQTHNNN